MDVPSVGPEGLENWKRFLQADARKNGGTASALLLLKPDNVPVKVTCCSQVIIVYELNDFEFLCEQTNWFAPE